jgi:hypothetical protein
MDSIAGNFVLVRADALSLLLPLEGMGAAGYLDQEPEPTELPGVFGIGGEDRSKFVVAPSGRLRPLTHYPEARFVVTPMEFEGKEILVAWSEMKVLIAARFDVHPLPLTAAGTASPVDGYVRMAGRPVFHTNPERLLAFMFSGAGPDE